MAFSTLKTKIANPARRRSPKRRTNPRRAAKRRTTAKRRAPRTRHKHKRNPTIPLIVSWTAGNPGRRKKVASTKRRRRKTAAKRSNPARHRRRSTRVVHHRRRHRNPAGIGNVMDWVQGGAGVLVGVVGTRAVPQLLLSEKNTGVAGYAANAVTAAGLGYLSHMLFPRNAVLTGSIIAGGFGALLARVISDQTPFGAQLSLTGLGDYGLGLYKKSNYPYPPQLQDGRMHGPGNANFTWGDGSQALSTVQSMGSDTGAAC
jgi:hypothetical protein